MERLLLLVSVIGIVYLALAVLAGTGHARDRYILYLQMKWSHLSGGVRQDKLQRRLLAAGIHIPAGKLTLFRYGAAALYGGFRLAGYIIAGGWSMEPLFTAAVILAVTSPVRVLPFGWLLTWLDHRQMINRDGELVSFIKLYENNRLQKRSYAQFGTFCSGVASHFRYIRQDLNELSERAVDEGAERAIEWFCGRFPEDHAFAGDIRSILLAVEGMDDDTEAALYLREQNGMIAKISSDQYLRKWSFFGDMASIINVIPSIATFLMIVSLAMQYILLIKDSFGGLEMFY